MSSDTISVTLNVLALIGAGAYVLGQASWREPTAVGVRLLTLLAVLMLLIAVRAATWRDDDLWLVRAEEALAALTPLFALVVAEGLLRRHAPSWLKVIVVVGVILVAGGALLRPPEMQAEFAIVLGSFLVGGLIAIAGLLFGRERRSLSHGENDAISTFFVGLLLALPVAATDFLAAAGLTEVRASGLALLVFVFFVSRVTSMGEGGFSALAEFLWTIAGAALAYAVLGFVAGWPEGPAIVQAASVLFGLLLVFRIIQYAREQRRRSDRRSLWEAFARAPTDSLEAFLSTILSVPAYERAKVLEGVSLAEYDHDRLRAVFLTDPVISFHDARGKSASEFEQLNVIFDQHESTHAIMVRAKPLALLLVNMPRVGAGVDVDQQLGVLAKLASRIGAAHA